MAIVIKKNLPKKYNNIHYRCLLLVKPDKKINFGGARESTTYFYKKSNGADNSNENDNSNHVKFAIGFSLIKTDILPGKSIIGKFGNQEKENNSIYNFPVLNAEISGNGNARLLFHGAPVKEVLKDSRPKSKNLSHWVPNLDTICSDQYFGKSLNNIKITRFCGRLTGETIDTVSSVILYGTDVLASQAIPRLIGVSRSDTVEPKSGNNVPDKQGKGKAIKHGDDAKSQNDMPSKLDPFSKAFRKNKKDYPTQLHVNSIQLLWSDGISSSVAVNLDKYGNFSFLYKNTKSIEGIVEILNYLVELNSLDIKEFDPLKRSQKALEAIVK